MSLVYWAEILGGNLGDNVPPVGPISSGNAENVKTTEVEAWGGKADLLQLCSIWKLGQPEGNCT